jgi:radical SAM superfamily enzyme YgiQ (UPF0313 family)
MRTLLVSANTERVNMPALPLGLALVAAATRRSGHDVRSLDLLGEADPAATLAKEIESFDPEAIGISVRNIDDQDMNRPRFLLEPVRDLVEACRRRSRAPLILGGAGYSIFPDAALAWLGADLGIEGEGEAVFPALLGCLERAEDPTLLPGVHARSAHGTARERWVAPRLDALPFPEPADWLVGKDLSDPMLWVPVQTRRGCPLKCIYCSTPRIEGRRIRHRSPLLVATHLEQLAAAGVTRIHFVDNTFNLPPSYALELCRSIAARDLGLSWRAIVHPYAVSEELVETMAAAGCVEVSLGFETGAESMLGPLGKRFDLAEVEDVSERFARHGVRRFGFLLLGAPGETAATIRESLDFAERLALDMFKVTVGVRIYPGSPLEEIARREGVVADDDDLLQPRFYAAPGTVDAARHELSARGIDP